MAAMELLNVEPQIITSCILKSQITVLKIIFAKSNGIAVNFGLVKINLFLFIAGFVGVFF